MGMHRGAAEGMTASEAPDPRAEKIKARKERKRGLRRAVRSGDMIGAARLFLSTPVPASGSVDDECQACLKLETVEVKFR